jgi:hypothetical protein
MIVARLQTKVQSKRKILSHKKLNMCNAIFYNLIAYDLVMP